MHNHHQHYGLFTLDQEIHLFVCLFVFFLLISNKINNWLVDRDDGFVISINSKLFIIHQLVVNK